MYYPYLRWRQGEMKAIENKPTDWENRVCPIWIVEEPVGELIDAALGNMRSSRALRLNILKSPMAVSNVAGLSLYHH